MHKFISSLVLSAVVLFNVSVALGIDKTYSVNQNGDYVFKIKDKAGWETILTVPITNIDVGKPIINKIEVQPIGSTEKVDRKIFTENVEICIETSDDLSGVDIIEYQIRGKGEAADPAQWKVYNETNKPQIIEEAEYTIYACCKDRANNQSDISSIEFMLDKTPPEVQYTLSTDQWTQELSITITAEDTLSGIDSIKLPDGQVVSENVAEFQVYSNDTYQFVVTNKAQRSTTAEVEITNIETTITPPKQLPEDKPLPPIEQLQEPDDKEFEWSAKPVTVDFKSLAPSGVKMYQYKTMPVSLISAKVRSQKILPYSPQKEWIETETPTVKVGGEGVHNISVRSISNAGNISKESNYKVKTDYTPPQISHVIEGKDVHIYATDNLSGVDRLIINGNEFKGGTATLKSPIGTQNVRAYDGVGLYTDYTIKISGGGTAGGGGSSDRDEISNVPSKPAEPMVKPDLPIEPPPVEAKPSIPPTKPSLPAIMNPIVPSETTQKPSSSLIEEQNPPIKDTGLDQNNGGFQTDTEEKDENLSTGLSFFDVYEIAIFVLLIVLFIVLVCAFMYEQMKQDVTALKNS